MSGDDAKNQRTELSAGAPMQARFAVTMAASIHRKKIMSLGTILLIIVILALVGVFPSWPHSASWGYGPSGAMGVVVIILIVLLLTGRL
jgi:hypothetical protein